ncbi:transglutaminase domain-containing protein [Paenibacillus macerans]|uniref:DUF4129 domain-containing transglutaminase family protein n=1 Tax=Paenibacillus macerans TaxID=44252 RepID=UPI002041EFE8|nr:transglutaminase domain-containing protein [Paenibacillus macerans]MCM3701207.1 transglutaminase domain-containing protein [Paenibacillus macerans]
MPAPSSKEEAAALAVFPAEGGISRPDVSFGAVPKDDAPAFGLRLVLSALLLGLFGEWLYPLYAFAANDQADTVTLFFVLTGLLLLAGCLRLPSFLYAMLPPFLIVCSLFYLHGQAEGWIWFIDFGKQLGADFGEFMQTGRLSGVSMEFRTLLLLIGWTLLVVSVQMLTLGRQNILLFLAVTVLYLIVLETAVGSELYLGLIRSAVLGLILQALVFGKRDPGYASGRGSLLGCGIVLVCVAGAALLSSQLPVQPIRPVSWQQIAQSLSEWSGAELTAAQETAAVFSVSGYSRSDAELGAPLQLRHDTYFTALSPRNTYWRGESKSVYTGRGWIQPAAGDGAKSAGTRETPNAATAASQPIKPETAPATEEIRQTVMFNEPLTGRVALLSGGIPVRSGFVFGGEQTPRVQVNPRFDPLADALVIDYAAAAGQIYGYEVTTLLQTPPGPALRDDHGPDEEGIAERYLQLPDSLPERVQNLGKELAAGANSRYDAALAVQSYLEKNYAYNLDTRRPPAEDDFVDRFLFEDKIGYCDHFSSAMVVLLRSGGVPARWVKGFAPGERAAAGRAGQNETMQRITVTYADAHAWVEVYFPQAGWVPFDPTPGFGEALAAGAGSPGDAAGGNAGTGLLEWLKQAVASLQKLAAEWTSAAAEIVASWREKLQPVPNPFVWTASLLGAGFAVLIAREIAWRGNRLQLWLYLRRPRRSFPGRSELLTAADRVWRELGQCYGPKPPAMTAREYLRSALQGRPGLTDAAEEFVAIWESLYYGGRQPERRESTKFLKHCRNLAFRRR